MAQYIERNRHLFLDVKDGQSRLKIAFGHLADDGFSFVLYTHNLSDAMRDQICAALRALHVECTITETIEYTDHEILSAPACFLSTRKRSTGAIPENKKQLVYNCSSGCPRCWTGAEQIDDLVLKGFSPRRSQAICETMDGHWLVRDTVRELISKTASEAHFRPIHGIGANIAGWFQAVPESCLPRFDPQTTGITIENQCCVCCQDGHYGLREAAMSPCYQRALWTPIAIAATWERFGVSRRDVIDDKFIQRVAPPMLCVSRQIATALLPYSRKEIKLIPVRLA